MATKRPWRVSANSSRQIVTDDKTIAEIVNHGISNVITKEESEANAVLIVKSVNEHDALNLVAESHENQRAIVAAIIGAFETAKDEKALANSVDRWINVARRIHSQAINASAVLAHCRLGKLQPQNRARQWRL